MTKSKTEWDYKETGRWMIVILGVFLMYKFIMKESLMYVIRQSLPPEEAGMMLGIMLGDKSGFSKIYYQYLQDSGLIHLVVVSGSNVMLLIGGVIESLAGVLGRKKTIAGGLLLGWGYAGMTGWGVPVIRAMLLISLVYLAQLYGRKYNFGRALAVAVIIMVAGDWTVVTTASFWLSITAFLGVVMAKNKWLTNILVSLWVTPILAMTFGRISLISPLANLAVSGLVEAATVAGVAGTMAGMIFLPLGRVILWIAYPILKYLTEVTEISGSGWWAAVSLDFNWWLLAGWYLILGYWFWKENAKN
jgi:competence protein ComEC